MNEVAFIFGIGVASTLFIVGIGVTFFSTRFRQSSAFRRFATWATIVGPLSTVILGAVVLLHAARHNHV